MTYVVVIIAVCLLQLVLLDVIPVQVDQIILTTGVKINLTRRSFVGTQIDVSGPVEEGLEYQATFTGMNGVKVATAIKISKVVFQQANVYGDLGN